MTNNKTVGSEKTVDYWTSKVVDVIAEVEQALPNRTNGRNN